MAVLKTESFPLATDMDVVQARQAVRSWAVAEGFKLIDQTKIVTAASELARNTVIHGGGGTMQILVHNDGAKRGLELVFEDTGPGIADIALALRDGYTSGNGLGMGLGGSKRLMNEFQIQSEVGKGTRISVKRWNSP
jgi:serine/threonine-protein kinase RsbT